MKHFRLFVGSLFCFLFLATSCEPLNLDQYIADENGSTGNPNVPLYQDLDFVLSGGEEFTMKYVKGGTFSMGTTSEQMDTDYEVFPVHNVTLSNFYLSEFEVTQSIWYKVMGTTVSEQRDLENTSRKLFGEGPLYPIYYVSFAECQMFMTKLNSLLKDQLPKGYSFSQPSEAQWEYAARGGSEADITVYSGENNIDYVAWYGSNTSKTNAVGGKQANEIGLYDMSGNVAEWCLDWYSATYYSRSPQNDPINTSSTSSRVVRGGSWRSNSAECKVAARSDEGVSARFDYCGIRIALTK